MEHAIDVEEFEREVLEHTAILYAVALRLTGEDGTAQWLTRRAIVRALLHRGNFARDMHIKSWLLKNLRETFAEEAPSRRHVRVSPARESDELLELLDDDVRQGLQSVPTELRDAVIMADMQERTCEEIAVAEGCSVGAAAARLKLGRQLLMAQLNMSKRKFCFA